MIRKNKIKRIKIANKIKESNRPKIKKKKQNNLNK